MIEAKATKPILLVTARKMRHAGCDRDECLKLTKKFLIIETLTAHEGNICHAAKALHVHRNTFTRDLKLLDLTKLPRELKRSAKQIRSQLEFTLSGCAFDNRGKRGMARGQHQPARRAMARAS